MLAMLLGSVLAVLALGFVLWPLVRGAVPVRASATAGELPPESSAIDALREIEFDRATGKLSDEDYATLRSTYTPRALDELRAREQEVIAAAPSVGRGVEEAAEALIARMKSTTLVCSHCGPRPEGDALFCSDCGRYLGSACGRCGSAVESDTARFCVSCGESLAA